MNYLELFSRGLISGDQAPECMAPVARDKIDSHTDLRSSNSSATKPGTASTIVRMVNEEHTPDETNTGRKENDIGTETQLVTALETIEEAGGWRMGVGNEPVKFCEVGKWWIKDEG